MQSRTALLTLLALAPACAVRAQTAAADDAATAPGPARWEAGLVAGGVRLSDYPGSDQSHTRRVVLPVFIYRGRVLRVDQGGIRGRVFDSPDWEINLSATAAFDARNNDARQGMPDLDYLFGVGPQLIYKGLQDVPGRPTLHFKWRAVMSTDLGRVHPRGITFDPELRWRVMPVAAAPLQLTLWLQPTWASGALHRYFYEVTPGQATPSRPAYAARAGYLGSEFGATLSRRLGRDASWFASVRALALHGAANAASPLLRDRTNIGVLAGVVWTPWQSSAPASD